MLRGVGNIGIDATNWRAAVECVAARNEAISERFDPPIERNHFTVLTEILDHLDNVNTLADRYKAVVNVDVTRLLELEERIRFREQELIRMIFNVA